MAVPSSRSGDPESGTAGAGVSCRHASACGARTARIRRCSGRSVGAGSVPGAELAREPLEALEARTVEADDAHLLVAGGVLRLQDRKSTRLNSSHVSISYAVFCLQKNINNKHNKHHRIYL